jgi:hypothetical protein
MADEYPEYTGLTQAELQAKLDANVARQEALDAQVNALRADARLAEQQRIDFQQNYDKGYSFKEIVDNGKALQANPNDPAALAEKARLDQLRADYSKAVAPYQQAEDSAYQSLRESPAVQEQNELFSEAGDIDHALRLADDPGAQWGGGSVSTETAPDAQEVPEEKPVAEEYDEDADEEDFPEDTEEVGKVEEQPAQDSDVVTDEEERTEDLEETDSEESAADTSQTSSNVTVTTAEEESKSKSQYTEIVITKGFPELKRNVLNNFSSYTYNFELYMFSVSDYNRYISDDTFKIETETGRLLIKSGGGRVNDKRFNPFFKDLDYFIDDVEINSVIAPSGSNVGTTNTEISFTITEPYGITLLNSLVLAARSLKSYNYIDQPYLLKLSFKGYDDKGNPANEASNNYYTRYIPIRFTDFKFSVTNEGTVYNVSAIPYHNLGVQSHKITIPTDIQLDAVTVGELLVQNLRTVTQQEVNIDPGVARAAGTTTRQTVTKQETIQGGLAGYLNYLEQEHVKQKGKSVADEYAFEIDPEIGESSIVLKELVNVLKSRNEKDPRKIALGQFYQNFEYDDKTQTYTIRAGTSIINVIHSIMRTSQYMMNQVVKEALSKTNQDYLKYEETLNKPIKFYRVVPRVELKEEYDTIRNCWAKKITYVIKQYHMYGKNFENLGQAQIKEFVKQYKYMYTGENTEVLGFDIDFNAAYFQKNIYNAATKSIQFTTRAAQTNPEQFADGNTAKFNPGSFSDAFPVQYEVVTDVGSSKDINDPRTSDMSNVIDNFMFMVLNDSADMVELNLEIIGDPSYIQSNDIREVLLTDVDASPYYDKNGSLNPDKEWHLDIEFRNPIDADTSTGLMEGFGLDAKGRAEISAPTISGYYRALEVKSSFSGGKFTQNLRCVREKQTRDFVSEKDTNPATNPLANNPAPKNSSIPRVNKDIKPQVPVNTVPDQTAVSTTDDAWEMAEDAWIDAPDVPNETQGIDLAEGESVADWEFGDIGTAPEPADPPTTFSEAPTTFSDDDQTEIGGP